MTRANIGNTHTTSSFGSIVEREHFVQIYSDEESVMDNLKSFVGGGLMSGDSCIIIATPDHRSVLENRLKERKLDTSNFQATGQLVLLDAHVTLDAFMVNGLPDRERFHDVIGGALQKLARPGKTVRAFGEMVALLWADDNQTAAIILEGLWNDISRAHSLTLFCAYPAHHFQEAGHKTALEEIHRLHTTTLSV